MLDQTDLILVSSFCRSGLFMGSLPRTANCAKKECSVQILPRGDPDLAGYGNGLCLYETFRGRYRHGSEGTVSLQSHQFGYLETAR